MHRLILCERVIVYDNLDAPLGWMSIGPTLFDAGDPELLARIYLDVVACAAISSQERPATVVNALSGLGKSYPADTSGGAIERPGLRLDVHEPL